MITRLQKIDELQEAVRELSISCRKQESPINYFRAQFEKVTQRLPGLDLYDKPEIKKRSWDELYQSLMNIKASLGMEKVMIEAGKSKP